MTAISVDHCGRVRSSFGCDIQIRLKTVVKMNCERVFEVYLQQRSKYRLNAITEKYLLITANSLVNSTIISERICMSRRLPLDCKNL